MGKNQYPMHPFPLHLQYPDPPNFVGDRDLRRRIDEASVARLSVGSPDVEAAYGRASIAALRLHHAITDVAVAITTAPVEALLGKTSGALRIEILRAVEHAQYAELRPYLQGWDHFLGQQSIRYRNHVIHSQLWNAGGADRFGRIEGDHYTEWTTDRLVFIAAGIDKSFLLLNQIFWEVLRDDHSGLAPVRTSNTHHFYSRQGGLIKDVRAMLPFLESQIPH